MALGQLMLLRLKPPSRNHAIGENLSAFGGAKGGGRKGGDGGTIPTYCFNAAISTCCATMAACCSWIKASISFTLVPSIVAKSGACNVTVDHAPNPPTMPLHLDS